jgi:hypothetical protein
MSTLTLHDLAFLALLQPAPAPPEATLLVDEAVIDFANPPWLVSDHMELFGTYARRSSGDLAPVYFLRSFAEVNTPGTYRWTFETRVAGPGVTSATLQFIAPPVTVPASESWYYYSADVTLEAGELPAVMEWQWTTSPVLYYDVFLRNLRVYRL